MSDFDKFWKEVKQQHSDALPRDDDGKVSVSAETDADVVYAAMGPIEPVPRLALTRAEAASSLSMSLDSFERHVQPHLKLLSVGRLRLVPVEELQRWVRGAHADDARAERDHWIRLFNRLDAAINHHKRDVERMGITDDADEALWAARDRVVSDAAKR